MASELATPEIAPARSAARLLWAGALVLGAAYFVTALARSGVMFEPLAAIPKPLVVAWKGTFTFLLAASVFVSGRMRAARLVAGALAVSAVADMLLAAVGVLAGGLCFALAHAIAILAYAGSPGLTISRPRALAAAAFPILATLAACALLAAAGRPWAMGLFVILSGTMAASALLSRFPLWLTGLGAVIFTLSDVLFFADLALFDGAARLGWLTWLCFAAGYALVARGAIQFNEARRV